MFFKIGLDKVSTGFCPNIVHARLIHFDVSQTITANNTDYNPAVALAA